METEVHVCDILGPVLVDMVLQSGTLDRSNYSGKARPSEFKVHSTQPTKQDIYGRL